jgi:metal-responsive CopG/Arc/MetJ family transcriptional regulator
MKTAISIPDSLYDKADNLAGRLHLSRSRLYAIALERFIKNHEESTITEKIDQFIEEHGQPVDPVFLNGALEDMKKVEW